MKVKYGDKLLDKPKDELENYGVSVSKTDLLTTDFWKTRLAGKVIRKTGNLTITSFQR